MNLDSNWKRFVATTMASQRVTMAKTTTDSQRQLAGHLALVEAAMAHLVVLASRWAVPQAYLDGVKSARNCIQNGATTDQLNELVRTTDSVFATILIQSDRGPAGPLQLDALSALGWTMRATLSLAAGMVDRANECGRHTLDAILRVVILTGHLRSDLTLLMREIGVSS